MGPILICDKSTLQGLGRAELNCLRKYYTLNIPPVLLAEIRGDLKKHDSASMSRDEVSRLADKLVPACTAMNVLFRDLIKAELMGDPVTMDGRPVIDGAKHVLGQDGKRGAVIEHRPEAKALLRWQVGEFQEAEELLAHIWRHSTQSIDLGAMQRKLQSAYSSKLKLSNLLQTAEFVDDLIASAAPELLLSWFLNDTGLDWPERAGAIERLRGSKNRSFQSQVPYTAHCLRVALIFHFGLAFSLIGTRTTNRIDMEYLYYTPFCQAFSSGDAFHQRLAPVVLKKNQVFIDRSELKTDLHRLADWWASLNDSEREQEEGRQGPPENEKSITHLLWSQVMRQGYRNLKHLSEEVRQRLFENVQKQHGGNSPADGAFKGSLDDSDFIIMKHHVRANGPCICGSDKSFRDCCGKKIVEAEAKK